MIMQSNELSLKVPPHDETSYIQENSCSTQLISIINPLRSKSSSPMTLTAYDHNISCLFFVCLNCSKFWKSWDERNSWLINLLTFQLVDDPLYLLSHSCLKGKKTLSKPAWPFVCFSSMLAVQHPQFYDIMFKFCVMVDNNNISSGFNFGENQVKDKTKCENLSKLYFTCNFLWTVFKIYNNILDL